MNTFSIHNTLNSGLAAVVLAAHCAASLTAADVTFGPEAVIEAARGGAADRDVVAPQIVPFLR